MDDKNQMIISGNTAMSMVENADSQNIKGTMQKIAVFHKTVQGALLKGKDYGVIPGTGTKPALLKPGAEKINMLFGCNPEYELISKDEDFRNGFFNYSFKCTLYKNGQPVGQGVGSCNSMEVKYKYITCYESQLADHGETEETAIKMTDRWGKVKYRILNPEPADKANTYLKMAKKRAFVDATLQLGSLSDLFTQDIEDDADEQQTAAETMTAAEAANIVLQSGKHKGRTIGEMMSDADGKKYLEYMNKEGKLDDVYKKAFEMLAAQGVPVASDNSLDDEEPPFK